MILGVFYWLRMQLLLAQHFEASAIFIYLYLRERLGRKEFSLATIMRQINMISRCEGLYRTDKLRGAELGACHHSYVLAICRNPGISQEELAKHICINKSNVTRHLSYLEEHGYVMRKQSETDRRVTLVYPTEKMEAVLPEVRKIIEEWNGYLTADLTDSELQLFRSVLERIAVRAKKYSDNREELKE